MLIGYKNLRQTKVYFSELLKYFNLDFKESTKTVYYTAVKNIIWILLMYVASYIIQIGLQTLRSLTIKHILDCLFKRFKLLTIIEPPLV